MTAMPDPLHGRHQWRPTDSIGYNGVGWVFRPSVRHFNKRVQLFLTEIVMEAPGGNSDADTNVALGTRGTLWNRIRMPV